MITEVILIKRLTAKLQVDYRHPVQTDTAQYVIRVLAPYILAVLREELAEAKREWERREVQR